MLSPESWRFIDVQKKNPCGGGMSTKTKTEPSANV